MGMNLISNYAANVAHRNLTASDAQATSSLAKLSSGTRVVSAKDDAASMAIGSRISSEVAALKQASVNAGQASSMLQIADGAMARTSDILKIGRAHVELQSLMRISYAVFCLKKKKIKQNRHTYNQIKTII